MKWVQRHIPTQESLQRYRLLRPFAHHLGQPALWRLNRRSVPRAVALGLFVGVIIPIMHTAIAAVLACPITTRARRAAVLVWNAIALADIVAVVATAQWVLFLSGHPETMGALTTFPWSVIPFFVVPIVIATHGLIFARAWHALGGQRDS